MIRNVTKILKLTRICTARKNFEVKFSSFFLLKSSDSNPYKDPTIKKAKNALYIYFFNQIKKRTVTSKLLRYIKTLITKKGLKIC